MRRAFFALRPSNLTAAGRCFRRIGVPPTLHLSTNAPSMPIVLTDACVQRLRTLAEKHGNKSLLRVMVNPGGCSGYQYEFKLDSSEPAADDLVVERDGAKVVIDSISIPYLEGATINYTQDLAKQAFAIATNPNASKKCGCGTSFEAKEKSVAASL